jgi:hypothetical protein
MMRYIRRLRKEMRNYLLLLAFLSTMCSGVADAPQVVESRDVDAGFFKQQFVSVSRIGDKVHFVSKRVMKVEGKSEFVREVTLAIGGGFTFPDHHGHQAIILKAVSETGVRIDYDSWFETPLGKDQVNHDTGSIEIPWLQAPPSNH